MRCSLRISPVVRWMTVAVVSSVIARTGLPRWERPTPTALLIPIAMILVSLLVPAEPLRWIAIAVSAALVIFNLMGV